MRTPLTLVCLFGLSSLFAYASTSYHFIFLGEVDCNNCFVPGPAAYSTIQPGDPFILNFDVDTGTNQVSNIDADFPTRSIDIQSGAATASFTWYTISSPYEYRWDFTIPGLSPYTMVFWFRTTTPGVVVGGVPPTIDANQFNYLREWDIYLNTGNGGPLVLETTLSNTPEPAALALVACGLFTFGLIKRRKSTRTPRQ